MRNVKIGNRWLGEGHPLFIVVEVGTTSNGDLPTALALIDAAKDAGADAVKFQIIGPEYFMSDKGVSYEYECEDGRRSENMYEMFKKLTYSREDWLKIRDHAKKRDIIFYATLDYVEGIPLAEELDLAAYKLSSWDALNIPLIQAMARTGRPIQIDTGPVTLGELDLLVDTIKAEGNDKIIIVHCSHSDRDDEVGLKAIPFLQKGLHYPVGFSADSRDFIPDIIAATLGCDLIEKRLTMDRKFPGHHHVKAVEPHELKDYISMIHRVRLLMGKEGVHPSSEDRRQRQLYYVSLVARRNLERGSQLSADDITCKRPGTGISPVHLPLVVGRKLQRDIQKDELISWSDL